MSFCSALYNYNSSSIMRALHLLVCVYRVLFSSPYIQLLQPVEFFVLTSIKVDFRWWVLPVFLRQHSATRATTCSNTISYHRCYYYRIIHHFKWTCQLCHRVLVLCLVYLVTSLPYPSCLSCHLSIVSLLNSLPYLISLSSIFVFLACRAVK